MFSAEKYGFSGVIWGSFQTCWPHCETIWKRRSLRHLGTERQHWRLSRFNVHLSFCDVTLKGYFQHAALNRTKWQPHHLLGTSVMPQLESTLIWDSMAHAVGNPSHRYQPTHLSAVTDIAELPVGQELHFQHAFTLLKICLFTFLSSK